MSLGECGSVIHPPLVGWSAMMTWESGHSSWDRLLDITALTQAVDGPSWDLRISGTVYLSSPYSDRPLVLHAVLKKRFQPSICNHILSNERWGAAPFILSAGMWASFRFISSQPNIPDILSAYLNGSMAVSAHIMAYQFGSLPSTPAIPATYLLSMPRTIHGPLHASVLVHLGPYQPFFLFAGSFSTFRMTSLPTSRRYPAQTWSTSCTRWSPADDGNPAAYLLDF